MAQIEIGLFTHWKLSDEEVLMGSILNINQKQVMQNELAMIAEQRTTQDYDPRNPLKFAQDEAFLKGQMSILRVMLSRSDESEKALRVLADKQSSLS